MRGTTKRGTGIAFIIGVYDMEIKVEVLQQVIVAIKQLPVKCDDFDVADRWVGIILALEEMIQTMQEEEANKEVTEDG